MKKSSSRVTTASTTGSDRQQAPVVPHKPEVPAPTAAMPTTRPGRRWFVIASLCVALFSTALHLPSLRGALITDDVVLVSDFDRRGCGPDPVECFSNLIGHFYYRPMLSASFAFGQKFHNNDPVWFHVENLVFHFLATLVAFAAFRALFRRRNTAFLAGAILALHPFNVTVTSWIGGRTDTMALGFMALYALGVMQAGRRIRLRMRLGTRAPKYLMQAGIWIGISCLALLASVFTKEQSMGLVFLAPLLATGFRCRPSGSGSRREKRGFPYWTSVYLVPVLIFAWVAHNVLQTLDFDHADWSFVQHVEMVGRTMCYYASEFFAPTLGDQHVSTIGPWREHEYLRATVGYVCAIGWCFAVVKTWKNRRVRLCLLWSSLCIGPVLNVIPIPNALAAPFRTAVAMFGISGVLAALLTSEEIGRKSKALFAVPTSTLQKSAIALLLGWYLIVTVKDVPNWLSEWSYVQAQVAADPNFVCARASVASGEMLRGHTDRALAEFDTCMNMLFGKETPVADYVGMLRSPQMLPVMQSMSTLRYRPLQYIPQVVRERGRALQALGKYHEAAENLRVVLIVTPGDTVARQSLVQCYRSLGETEKADSVQHMEDVLNGKAL